MNNQAILDSMFSDWVKATMPNIHARLENPTSIIEILELYPAFIKVIPYPTDYQCIVAVRQCGLLLEYIQEQTDPIVKHAIKQNPQAIQHAHYISPENAELVVSIDGISLKYIRYQSISLCLTAVTQNGMALQYVCNPTIEIILAAVKQNPDAIAYVNPEFFTVFKEIPQELPR